MTPDPSPAGPLSYGADLIKAERLRQKREEGWTESQDWSKPGNYPAPDVLQRIFNGMMSDLHEISQSPAFLGAELRDAVQEVEKEKIAGKGVSGAKKGSLDEAVDAEVKKLLDSGILQEMPSARLKELREFWRGIMSKEPLQEGLGNPKLGLTPRQKRVLKKGRKGR